jgi:SAM-dependent methyltransferase
MSSSVTRREQLRAYLQRSRSLGPVAARLNRVVSGARFRGSHDYWDRRYEAGGDSGVGSTGALAAFKADFLNDFVAREHVGSVIELGCGDGRQLALSRYPSYIGLDVARDAIQRCKKAFGADETKSFFLYDPDCFVDHAGVFRTDLALSLDVVFHLVEDAVFEQHMRHLFDAGRRFVVVYSSDFDGPGMAAHVRHRNVSAWVASHLPAWERTSVVENPHTEHDDGTPTIAKFLVFERRARD